MHGTKHSRNAQSSRADVSHWIHGTALGSSVMYCCAAAKFFWFLLFMFLTLLYFTYYGVACVAITPNLMMAAIISGAFYGLMNLFAGFVMPKPDFPGWWIWVSSHAYPPADITLGVCA